MKADRAALARYAGIILSLLGGLFVFDFARSVDLSALRTVSSGDLAAVCLIMLALYIAVMLLGMVAWRRILAHLSGTAIGARSVFPVFSQANIAKYIPGNVFQYAVRNFLGHGLGWKHADIALSSLLEVALGLAAFAIVVAVALSSSASPLPPNALHWGGERVAAAAAVLAVLLVPLLAIRPIRAFAWSVARPLITLRFAAVSAFVIAVYIVSFALTGLMFSVVYPVLFHIPLDLRQHLVIVSASTIAVFAGYVTPGSPGGLGVRESLIVIMLAPAFGSAETFCAMALHRVISILGDVLLYLASLALPAGRQPELGGGEQ